MAKRGVPEHPKTLRLARLLGVEPWAAVGLLEVFWHWSSRYAITGVINHSPEDLADSIRYGGDAKAMFAALVKAGWVDHVEGVGFVIHDIVDHADNTWKANLKRSRKQFWVHQEGSHNSVTTQSQLSCEPPESTPEPTPEPLHTQAGQNGKTIAPATIQGPMPHEWQSLPEPERERVLAIAQPFAHVLNSEGRPCYVLDDFDTMPETLAAWDAAGLQEDGRKRLYDEWRAWHMREDRNPFPLPAVALRGNWLDNALTSQARRIRSAKAGPKTDAADFAEAVARGMTGG